MLLMTRGFSINEEIEFKKIQIRQVNSIRNN